jgi:hypothetical protein
LTATQPGGPSNHDIGVVPATWTEVGRGGDLGFVCEEEANAALLFDREVDPREAWSSKVLGAIR